ncbi:MAG: hypothetical protein Q7K55_03325 [Candidatus Levybacteria bacterium]|nr:hypothetical protein [Candidatus Levybacteria bacterium]
MTRNNESKTENVIDSGMEKLKRELDKSGYKISGKPIPGLTEFDPSVFPIKPIKDKVVTESHRGMNFPTEKKKPTSFRKKF